jgi:hypothetical protein
VTIREEQRGGQTVWTFATVGHARLKSAPARVTVADGRYRVGGAAWGAPIERVEVRVDGGSWIPATITSRDDGERSDSRKGHTWALWEFDWGSPAAGTHTIASRAIDVDGEVQPQPDDALLAAKRTFWESNGQISRQVKIP